MKRARVNMAMVVALWGFGVAWSPARAVGQCCGDCNGDGVVTVDEIVTTVNRALGSCADDGICRIGSCEAQLATCRDELAGQCDAGSVPTSEQDRVRAVVSSFYTAFSSNSFDTWAPDFTTEDWNHISPGGGWTQGRENTLAVLRQVHSTFLSGVTDTLLYMSVRFATCDVAVATATSRVSTYTTPDGVTHENERQRRTFVVVKRSDRWLVMQDHNTIVG
jgi:uncharacterized protein (TIGR02246 family)